MTEIAIIGGSGLTTLKGLEIVRREVARTPYGECSAPMAFGKLGGVEVLFLPRHGPRHTIPPHEVNYRANLWALKEAGIKKIIAVGAVGGITEGYLAPGTLSLPTQIIDYTYGREHTFYTAANKQVIHTDFTNPYCEELRSVLVKASEGAGLNAVDVSYDAQTVDLTGYALASELRTLSRASDAIKLRLDAIQSHAMSLMQSGGVVPGWSLDRAYGKRRWTDPKNIGLLEALSGTTLTESKPVTPAQAEKRGVHKKLVKQFTTTPETGHKLVERDGSAKAAQVFGTPPKEIGQ